MKKIFLLSLFTLLFFNVSAFAGSLYFYGGDWEPNDPNANGLANGTSRGMPGDPYGGALYQNFVAGTAIHIWGLFSNDAMSFFPTSGYWEIRSGVSEGNGGTLIASGSGNVNVTSTGRSGFGFDEYNNAVYGLNVDLPANTYWFAVVPTCPTCDGLSYNTNSLHGVNAVGTQISDQQYWNSPYYGENFTNANIAIPGEGSSFSSGVYADVLPEPSSMILLGSGVLAVAGAVRGRMRM